jgi:hypothetical protein
LGYRASDASSLPFDSAVVAVAELACLDQVVTRKLDVDEEHKCQLEQHVVMLAALCVYKIDGTTTYSYNINHIVDFFLFWITVG